MALTVLRLMFKLKMDAIAPAKDLLCTNLTEALLAFFENAGVGCSEVEHTALSRAVDQPNTHVEVTYHLLHDVAAAAAFDRAALKVVQNHFLLHTGFRVSSKAPSAVQRGHTGGGAPDGGRGHHKRSPHHRHHRRSPVPPAKRDEIDDDEHELTDEILTLHDELHQAVAPAEGAGGASGGGGGGGGPGTGGDADDPAVDEVVRCTGCERRAAIAALAKRGGDTLDAVWDLNVANGSWRAAAAT